MLYVLAALLIAGWLYLTFLGFRLNREGSDRALGTGAAAGAAADPVADRRPAEQAGGQTPVTG